MQTAYLLRFASTLCNPSFRLFPGLVECEQSSFTATLDELIRLCDKLCVEDPTRKLCVRSDRVGRSVPRDLRNLGSGVDELGLHCDRRINGRGTLEPVGEQELRVVLADSCAGEKEGCEMRR